MVTDVARPAVLSDQAGDPGARRAGHLLNELLHQTLVWLPEAVVLEADQRAADEDVGGSAVGDLGVGRFAALSRRRASG